MSTEPTGLRAPTQPVGEPEAPSRPADGGVGSPTGSTPGSPRSTAGATVEQRRTRRSGEIAEASSDQPVRRRPAPAETNRSRAGTRKAPPRRRRKARMVHRVVRHVEVWSVAKVLTGFAACGYLIGMVSGYLLWRAADRVGTIDGIEGFMEDSGGYDTFEILGDVVFTSAAIGGAILAVAFVALGVLAAVLFNLISDLTGGIRMTAIDEDLIVAPARRPRPQPAGTPGGADRTPNGSPTGAQPTTSSTGPSASSSGPSSGEPGRGASRPTPDPA